MHSVSSSIGSYSVTRDASTSLSQAAAGSSNPSSCADDGGESLETCRPLIRLDPLPGEQEPHEVRRTHRLDLGPEPVQGIAVDPGQQPAVAPLERVGRLRG